MISRILHSAAHNISAAAYMQQPLARQKLIRKNPTHPRIEYEIYSWTVFAWRPTCSVNLEQETSWPQSGASLCPDRKVCSLTHCQVDTEGPRDNAGSNSEVRVSQKPLLETINFERSQIHSPPQLQTVAKRLFGSRRLFWARSERCGRVRVSNPLTAMRGRHERIPLRPLLNVK